MSARMHVTASKIKRRRHNSLLRADVPQSLLVMQPGLGGGGGGGRLSKLSWGEGGVTLGTRHQFIKGATQRNKQPSTFTTQSG